MDRWHLISIELKLMLELSCSSSSSVSQWIDLAAMNEPKRHLPGFEFSLPAGSYSVLQTVLSRFSQSSKHTLRGRDDSRDDMSHNGNAKWQSAGIADSAHCCEISLDVAIKVKRAKTIFISECPIQLGNE